MKGLCIGLLAIAATTSCANADLYQLTIKSVQLDVEVADTEETRARGLMFRDSIPEKQGMLFVFNQAAPRAFYMRDTSVPLSIAYIDARLVVLEIHDMQPFSLETVLSRSPAMYALEMNQGAFRNLGISPGDQVVLSKELEERLAQ